MAHLQAQKKLKKSVGPRPFWPRACWSHFGPFRVLTTPSVHRVKIFCPNLQAINLLSRETTIGLIKKIPRAFPAIFSSELKTTFFDSLSEMTHHGTVLAQKSWPTGLIVSPRAVLSARLSNSKFFDNSRSGLIPLCSNS